MSMESPLIVVHASGTDSRDGNFLDVLTHQVD